MKLIRAYKGRFVFEIHQVDKQLLFDLLKLYPLVPATHHRLSKGSQIPDQEANQYLLEELLKAQRAEYQKQLTALFKDSNRFTECEAGLRFTLSRGEIEWLLQVVNDVRIGSWIALGSPDQEQEQQHWKSKAISPHLLNMAMAADIEMILLKAVSRGLPARP